MPELPEVENVVRTLRPGLVGRHIDAVRASGLKLRQPIDLPALKRACHNASVLAVARVGKYLTVDLSTGKVLLAHLGMSGRLVFAPRKEAERPHTHVVLSLDNGVDLRLVDPRRFGLLRVYLRSQLRQSTELAVLGPDPFDAVFTVDYLRAELRASKQPLKAFLLDQKRVAGLGNIYVCEALYFSRLSPLRRADRVQSVAAARLHAAILDVLSRAIENRGTSFSDYVDADGNAGENQHSLAAYGREGEACPQCSKAITRAVQSGRSTFYCRNCQR